VFERFTDRARRVLVLAQDEARLLGHGFIGTEHILLGLIGEDQGVAAKALEALDISLDAVRHEVVEIIGTAGQPRGGSPPFTPRAKKVLELSLREALQLDHNYIGTEHILLGIVREGEGVGAQVLVRLGADLERTRAQVLDLLSGFTPEQATGEARPPYARGRFGVARSSPETTGDLPYCPRCGHSVVDNLGYAPLVATSLTDPDTTATVVVAFCRSCSFVLGTAPVTGA
jgi:ATP-dependent Clp protease ATP-binding subunit ClpA